jgi:hypothetical protein
VLRHITNNFSLTISFRKVSFRFASQVLLSYFLAELFEVFLRKDFSRQSFVSEKLFTSQKVFSCFFEKPMIILLCKRFAG